MSLAGMIFVAAVAVAGILTDATADAFDLGQCDSRQYEARERRCKDDSKLSMHPGMIAPSLTAQARVRFLSAGSASRCAR